MSRLTIWCSVAGSLNGIGIETKAGTETWSTIYAYPTALAGIDPDQMALDFLGIKKGRYAGRDGTESTRATSSGFHYWSTHSINWVNWVYVWLFKKKGYLGTTITGSIIESIIGSIISSRSRCNSSSIPRWSSSSSSLPIIIIESISSRPSLPYSSRFSSRCSQLVEQLVLMIVRITLLIVQLIQ